MNHIRPRDGTPLWVRTLVRIATETGDPEFLAMAADIKQRNLETDVENANAYVSITREFHEFVGSSASNRLLTLLSHCMMAMFTLRVNQSVFPKEERSSVIAEHDCILDLILKGEAKAAEAQMQEHMRRFVDRVKGAQPDIFFQVVSWR